MAKKKSKSKAKSVAIDDDDDVAPKKSKKPASDAPTGTPSDAYVGLLAISLLGLIFGAVLLYLDHDELATKKADPPTVALSDNGLNYVQAGAPAK